MQAKTPPAGRKLMRDINQNTLLNLIRKHAPISRPQLAELSGLSAATVMSLTNELVERKTVLERGVSESTGGRKAALLEIHADGGYVVGLSVRGFDTTGVLINLHGDIVFSERWEITLRHESTHAIELLAECVSRLLTHARFSADQVIGVGCALPGYIDADAGRCVDSWNLAWHHIEISGPLSARLGLPVFIDNDVSCLATYENLFGRGSSYLHFLNASFGRGLCLGMIINGEVYRGATGGAGEFGHTVAVAGGRLCECGKRGCLEEYVSFRGIITSYQEHLGAGAFTLLPVGAHPDQAMQLEEATIRELLARADRGDEAALFAFQRTGELLGISLANLVNLLNPQCIILTGEGTIVERHMFVPMEAALRRSIFSELGVSLRLLIEPLASYENWARGAGGLVLRRFFASPLGIQAPSPLKHLASPR